jgi:DNA-binding MarR family transcriptional regulator
MLLYASQRIEARLESAVADSGLSLSKLNVLDHLVKAGGPLPLSRLAERLSCVKSNMTQLIDKLEADGLVRRVNDPEDRRSVLALITDEGRRRYESGSVALAEQEQQFFQELTTEEQDQFAQFLRRLNNG